MEAAVSPNLKLGASDRWSASGTIKRMNRRREILEEATTLRWSMEGVNKRAERRKAVMKKYGVLI